ncbi:MAG: creatininase family protein [Oscillospiraceae bacterium]|nr:creatininase family protein [Oscillospiraceae bacterium]
MGKFISELTYEQCKDLINEKTVIVLPIGGGSKEHGNHLPMGTDYFVADYLAKEITSRCDVITLPTMPFAYFPNFIKWKGSVTVDYQHFIDYTKDVLLSFVRFGVKKFFILDDGFSTHIPLKLLALSMNNEYDVKVAVSDCTGIGREAEAAVCQQPKGGHGDEAETSIMLNIRPDLVQMDKTTEEYSSAFPYSKGKGFEKIYFPNRMCTPCGTNGNSTLASKEKGEAILQAQVEDLVNFLNEFIAWEPCDYYEE